MSRVQQLLTVLVLVILTGVLPLYEVTTPQHHYYVTLLPQLYSTHLTVVSYLYLVPYLTLLTLLLLGIWCEKLISYTYVPALLLLTTLLLTALFHTCTTGSSLRWGPGALTLVLLTALLSLRNMEIRYVTPRRVLLLCPRCRRVLVGECCVYCGWGKS